MKKVPLYRWLNPVEFHSNIVFSHVINSRVLFVENGLSYSVVPSNDIALTQDVESITLLFLKFLKVKLSFSKSQCVMNQPMLFPTGPHKMNSDLSLK